MDLKDVKSEKKIENTCTRQPEAVNANACKFYCFWIFVDLPPLKIEQQIQKVKWPDLLLIPTS